MHFSKPSQAPVLPVYPFLFGIFPVLYLWSANREQQPAYVVIPSLLITLAALLVMYLAALVLQRNAHRAALTTTVLSLFMLSYGHIANLVENAEVRLDQRYLLIAAALLVLAVLIWTIARRYGSPQLTKALNVVAAALVLFQLVTAVPYYIKMERLGKTGGSSEGNAKQEKIIPPSGQSRLQASLGSRRADVPARQAPGQRDVYFILVDNYGRQDVLQEKSSFDNSELIAALEERGFVLPDCAQGNYFWTAPAMTSILNMNYLDELGIKETSYTRRGHYGDMAPLMQNSEVIRKFRSYGYHVVTFRGFMGLIDIQNSDTYVSFEKDLAYNQRLETAKFQELYFETTIFDLINEHLHIYPELLMERAPGLMANFLPEEGLMEERFLKEYQQTLYAFDTLERIPDEIESPKFVYAHLYSAHWPHLIRPDGGMRLPVNEKITVEGYVDGVKFTNNRILKIIDKILAESEVEPVIILQGDHANGWEGKVEWSGTDRLKILSAYYLPDGGDALLSDTITPVNNFRLVFQHYFNEPVELLPDVSYYLDPQTKKVAEAPQSCVSDGGK